jgi:hypothetical protein
MLLVDGSFGLEKLQNKPLDLRLKSIAYPRLKWRGGEDGIFMRCMKLYSDWPARLSAF